MHSRASFETYYSRSPGILSTPEFQEQFMIHGLKATEFNCCRCVAEPQMIDPQGQDIGNPMGSSTCKKCQKPPCNKCTYRTSMVQPVKSTRIINIELEEQYEAMYGWICCTCGRVERVYPGYKRKSRASSITSIVNPDSMVGRSGKFQLDFRSHKCNGCQSKCCYDCFAFVEGNGIQVTETDGKGKPLTRTNSNLSTMSKMSAKARTITATVKAKIQRTVSRRSNALSRKNSVTGDGYVHLRESQRSKEDFLAPEFSEPATQSRLPPRPPGRRFDPQLPPVPKAEIRQAVLKLDKNIVHDIASQKVLALMDDLDDVFRDF